MVYKGEELSNYPICDTDIWVDIVLAKLDDRLIEKYKKIVVADVVENEILKFGKNEYFKVIAEKYEVLKKNEKIIGNGSDRFHDCSNGWLRTGSRNHRDSS